MEHGYNHYEDSGQEIFLITGTVFSFKAILSIINGSLSFIEYSTIFVMGVFFWNALNIAQTGYLALDTTQFVEKDRIVFDVFLPNYIYEL